MQARACFAEEDARWHSKVAGALGRILRNPPPGISMPVSCYDPIRKHGLTMGAGERGGRPNLVDIEARLCHAFRTTRDRQRVYLARQRVQQTIRRCVENIVRMIGQHGWFRVRRQMKQSARAREFVCSMLYLMRTGITYQRRCILPCVEDLNVLLPLQVFLHRVFHIRPKCITEGENIIKLDTRRFVLE